MSKTNRLELPFLYTQQRQKELTVNEAFTLIDSLSNGVIIDLKASKPNIDTKPQNGDVYFILEPNYEAWLEYDKHLAIYYEGWSFIKPKEGMMFWVKNCGFYYFYNNENWKILETPSNSNPENHITIVNVTQSKQTINLTTNSIILLNINIASEITFSLSTDIASFNLIIETNNNLLSFTQKIVATNSVKELLKNVGASNTTLIANCIFYKEKIIFTNFSKISK